MRKFTLPLLLTLTVTLTALVVGGCKSQPKRPTPQDIAEAHWDDAVMGKAPGEGDLTNQGPAVPVGTTPAPGSANWPMDATAPFIRPAPDVPPIDGFQPAPEAFKPLLPTGYQEINPANPEVVTPNYAPRPDVIPAPANAPVEPGPNLPIARLMDMYYQEFNTDLWLMTRATIRTPQFNGELYAGSIAIDQALEVRAGYDDKNTQVEIVRVIKDDKRIVVYYLYRYLGPPGSRSLGGRLQYYWFEITSSMLYTMIQQKRSGIMGFEIAVEEIMASDLPTYR